LEDPFFMDKIVTGDETWVYEYDPMTMSQSSEWRRPSEPRPKRLKLVKSRIKVMLILFFNSDGIVHYEFLENNRTVNQIVYREILMRLKDKMVEGSYFSLD
jgi:hypothetical protein